MPEKSNLPVVVKDNHMLKNIKSKASRLGKFLGYSAVTGGLIIGGVLFPPALIPAIVVSLYTGQKALNNSIYQEYKGLAFVTKKHANNIKIYQDLRNISVLKELKGLNNFEKVRLYAITVNYWNIKVQRRTKR